MPNVRVDIVWISGSGTKTQTIDCLGVDNGASTDIVTVLDMDGGGSFLINIAATRSIRTSSIDNGAVV